MSPTTDDYNKRDEHEAGEKLEVRRAKRILFIIFISVLGCALFLYFFTRTVGLW